MTTSNLVVGAIAIGRSGVGGIITQIESESDRVTIKLQGGTKKRVPIGSIVRFELPKPQSKIGDRVRFWGGLPTGSSTLTPTERSIKLGLPIGYQLTIESIDGDDFIARTDYGSFQLTADELEVIA